MEQKSGKIGSKDKGVKQNLRVIYLGCIFDENTSKKPYR